MRSWIVGITVICALVVAAWSISTVMGSVYGSNADSTIEGCCGGIEQTEASFGSGSGCGSKDGGSQDGGCCGSGTSDASPEELASAYYFEKTGDSDFEVVIEDLGCHSEAEIIKDGHVVMELSINGGQVTEI